MPTSPPPYSATWTAANGDWSTAADWLEFDPNTFLATIGEGRKLMTAPKKKTIYAQGAEAAQQQEPAVLAPQENRAAHLHLRGGKIAAEKLRGGLQDERRHHFLVEKEDERNPAQFHFQRISIRRQPKMNIQKTMIHRLERKRKCQLGIHLPSDLRESRHRTKWHKFQVSIFQGFKA